MNFIKSLTFMFFIINVAFGAKPTDQYKETQPIIRNSKPTDQYKETLSIIRNSKPTYQYKDTPTYLRSVKLV
jgi:hypothetical protein